LSDVLWRTGSRLESVGGPRARQSRRHGRGSRGWARARHERFRGLCEHFFIQVGGNAPLRSRLCRLNRVGWMRRTGAHDGCGSRSMSRLW